MEMRMNFLSVIILAVLFLVLGLLLAPKNITQSPADYRELFVIGSAKAKVLPDVAVININIASRDDTAKLALEKSKKQLEKLQKYFDSIKEKYGDVKLETIYFDLTPYYEYDKNSETYVQKGYEAKYNLNLRIPDFNSKGSLLVDSISELAKIEALTIPNVYFELSDDLQESTKKSLIADAMKDGWSKAKAIGDAGFFVLNTVPKEVTLNYSDYIPYYYKAESTSIGYLGGAEKNIVPKEVELRVSVDLTYSYK